MNQWEAMKPIVSLTASQSLSQIASFLYHRTGQFEVEAWAATYCSQVS